MAGPALASVHINEIMVRNTSFKHNEDYNFVGWVELYNSGDEMVDLSNCFFSDSESNIYKWQSLANTQILRKNAGWRERNGSLRNSHHGNHEQQCDSDHGPNLRT